MQLQRCDRENLIGRGRESDEESFQCKETLNDIKPANGENRVKLCGCRCRCNEVGKEDPVNNKKQKRKSAKRRQKQRQKQQKERAMLTLEQIIRDIYSLKYTFNRARREVRECLEIQNNKDKVCQYINVAIRSEVETIRKQIAQSVKKYQHVEPGSEHEAVKAIFGPIQQIARASNEVEELINLFVNQFLEEDQIPLQRNFGRTTLKFLVKADLYKSGTFSKICSYIYKEPAKRYPNERELINYMMIILNHEDEGSASESQETDEEEYIDEEEDWEEEGSTIESQRESIEKQPVKEEPKAKKKHRRRKMKDEMDNNYEAILKRTEQMELQKYERQECHVTEECLARLRKWKWRYMKVGPK